MDQAQIEYVKSQLAAGHDPEAIKDVMRQHGYDDDLIERLFVAAGQATPEQQGDTHVQSSEDTYVPSATSEYGSSTVQSGGSLVSYGAMLSAGWNVAFGNLTLVGGALLAMLLLVVLSFLALFVFGAGAAMSLVAGGGAGMGITMVIVIIVFYLFAYVYGSVVGLAVVRGLLLRETEPGFWHNFGASWGYVLSFILITIYTQVLTGLGMVLLFIPGLIIAVYLSMTQMALLAEGRRGFSALVRSIDLVYGRWWSVFGRIMVIGFVLVCAYILCAMLFGFLSATMGEAVGILFFFLLIPLFILLGFWFVGALVVLFESLQRVAPATEFDAKNHSSIKLWMRIAVLAAIIIPSLSLMLAAPAFMNLLEMSNEFPLMEEGDVPTVPDPATNLESARRDARDAAIRATLTNFRAQAELFASQPDGSISYEGLCNQLGNDSSEDSVQCESGADWYVVQAQLSSGEWYCVDSVGNADTRSQARAGEQSCVDMPIADSDRLEESPVATSSQIEDGAIDSATGTTTERSLDTGLNDPDIAR